jgi:hypothetical protein
VQSPISHPQRNTADDLRIDHLRYLSERPYRRLIHAELRRRARKSGLRTTIVEHERDWSCCRREEWPVTGLRLQRALNEDGLRTALVERLGTAVAIILPDEGVSS